MSDSSRTVLRMALAGLLLGAAPPRAAALELFGLCLDAQCRREKAAAELIDPLFYAVTMGVGGDDLPDDGTLDADLRAASELWRGRDEPVAGAASLVARARGDYARILNALYDAGHYGGTISILIDGREAADIAPGATLGEAPVVTVSVDPGPPFRFGAARIVRQAPEPVDADDIVDLPGQRGFAPGLPARAGAVRTAGELAIEAWRQQGHPKARIAAEDVAAVHPDARLDATLTVDPGPSAVFGPTAVSGTRLVDPDFVAYMAAIPEGEAFDPDAIRAAQRRLDRLGVFATRRIEEAETVGPDGTLPMGVLVDERKPRRVGLGATVSSIDGAGVEAFFLHRNLMGRAERLRVDARVGGLGADGETDARRFDYELSASLVRPGLFSPDTDGFGEVFARREVNESYLETAVGGRAGVTHYFGEAIRLDTAVFGRVSEVEDVFGTRSFRLAGLDATGVFDFRDDRLEPTAGFYAATGLRPFYEFERAYAALRVEGELRGYQDFATDGRTVLAARGKAGALAGPDPIDLPPDQLFFAGGGGSVRGYAYRNIGIPVVDPLTGRRGVSGGRSLLEGSVELRQRFGESWGAVVFADAGLVGSNPVPDFALPLRVGVGVGLRYYTGLGPIRLDLALPLDPQPDDPSFGLYVGIGQAF